MPSPPRPPLSRFCAARHAGPPLAAALALAAAGAHAFTATINAATPRAIYLQVGVGSFSGTYSGGGTPGNNSTINSVTATVAANAIGSGTAQTMTTNSTASASPYDAYAFCTPGNGQVYIGGFYRTTGNSGANGTLSVTTPANLVNTSGDTLPFSTISWTSAGNDGTTTIANGTFAGGTTQTLYSVARNNWFETCFTFRYANANLVAAGTFSGRATYTLTAP